MAQDHEIGGGVALPQTAGTFSERDIQVPVQVVFNPPVAADGSQDLGCKCFAPTEENDQIENCWWTH